MITLVHDERATLMEVLRNDVAAVELCQLFGQISQIWDDLVDGDKQVSAEEINRAFVAALVHIPVNPFYNAHFVILQPLVCAAINAWLDSNDLPDTDIPNRNVQAYVLRDRLQEFVLACARIVGGWAWMRQVSLTVRREFTSRETLDEFEFEFITESEAEMIAREFPGQETTT